MRGILRRFACCANCPASKKTSAKAALGVIFSGGEAVRIVGATVRDYLRSGFLVRSRTNFATRLAIRFVLLVTSSPQTSSEVVRLSRNGRRRFIPSHPCIDALIAGAGPFLMTWCAKIHRPVTPRAARF